MNLRSAAQAVSILDARIFFRRAVRFADLAAFVQVREVARGRACAGISACMHDARVECTGTAAQGVQRKGGGNIGGIDENVCVVQRETEQGQHSLRAVQKRKPFFCFECNGNDAGASQGIAAGKFFALVEQLRLRR